MSAATVVSVKSGFWSDPNTWSTGVVPGAGDMVQIQSGHAVTYDANSMAVITSILVNGTLEFEHLTNTRLEVGVIVVARNPQFDMSTPCSHPGHHMAGSGTPTIQVGSPDRPIDPNANAIIRLHATAGADLNCAPGIIDHGGLMDFHGAPVTPTWTKLAATAPAGTDVLHLAQANNWKIGDQVLITATFDPPGRSPIGTILNGIHVPESERRFIAGISDDGKTIILDSPLQYQHIGTSDAAGLRGEVANLSRNVVVESADVNGLARGHTMYHFNAKGSISHAEFRHLGKEATLGRYPVHFHQVGSSMRGSYVRGASIWDSTNRWVVIHGTEYMVVRDTVGFNSLGHGYFLEDGSEVYNFLDGNLGVQARDSVPIPGQALPYDKNRGACYWAANARNFIFGNTFVECDNDDSFILDYAPGNNSMMIEVLQPDGSRQTVDVRGLSGGLVRDLELHSNWGWGLWVLNGVYPEDEPLVIENTRIWNTEYSADISSDNVVVDGLEIFNSSYGVYNLYPGPHLIRNAYIENVHTHGAFMTYRGGHGTFLYEDIETKSSGLVFRMTAQNEVGADGDPIQIHARNVTVLDPIFQSRVGQYQTAWVGSEGTNVRPDPLLMLVHHDLFGEDSDGIFLPAVQSTLQEGVPAGLQFSAATGIEDGNGILLEGRGDFQYAIGDIAWPGSPLENPVDRVPPATTILWPQRGSRVVASGNSLEVCGVALDQFGIESVTVNGVAATIDPNGHDWCASLVGLSPGPLEITAFATDLTGQVDLNPHVIDVEICPANECPAPINQPPLASFTLAPPSGVAPFTVSFDASGSSDPEGGTLSFTWDYGDGTTGTGMTVDHVYNIPGDYTVVLTVTNNADMSTTTTANVTAAAVAPLEVRISASSDDAEENRSGGVSLTSSDLELADDGSSVNRTIGLRFVGVDIPPGSEILSAYVQFQVDEVSTGPVALEIRGEANGAALAFVKSTGNVSSRPTTGATVAWSPPDWSTVGAAGAEQRTPDLKNIIQEIVDQADWSQGNAMALIITGSGRRTAESYNGSPSGAALLHIEYDPNGSAQPNEPPSASFIATPSSGEAPLLVSFDALGSRDPEGGALSYVWDYGDGTTGIGLISGHVFTVAGNYEVSLTVTDQAGRSDTTTRTVVVVSNQPPQASFTATPSSGMAPLTVSFDALGSSDPEGETLSYAWDYGDGTTGIGLISSHVYTVAGGYEVSLTVTDPAGLSDTATQTIAVVANEPPLASFTATPSSGMAPLAVSFDASGSSDPEGGALSYAWDYGDGTSAIGTTSSHVYTAAGSYAVFLTVTDQAGLSDMTTWTVTVVVNQPPMVNFTATPSSGVAPLVVSFDASGSSDPEGGALSYAWDFGDDTMGAGAATNHVYDLPGAYTATLTVTDDSGNSDTATRVVTATASTVGPINIRVSAANDDAEENQSGGMYLSSSDLELADDLGTNSPGQTIGLRFVGVDIPAGSKILSAYVQFQVDEVSTGPAALEIRGEASGASLAFVGLTGDITSRPTTGASVAWSPPDWSTVGVAGAEQRTPDLKYVIQEIVDQLDWFSSNPVALIITGSGRRAAESYNGSPGAAPLLHIEYDPNGGALDNKPPLASFTMTPSSGVAPVAVSFDASGSRDPEGDALSYAWDYGDGTTGIGVTSSHVYDTPKAYIVTLTVTDDVGKSGTATRTVTVTTVGPIDVRVSATSDDAEENQWGGMYLSSSDLELADDVGTNSPGQTIGLRFVGVDIPAGSNILSAYIQFQVDEKSTGPASLEIRGEASGASLAFVGLIGDITSRPTTGALVAWAPPDWTSVGAAGVEQRTPDLKDIIQEIVDRPDWFAGNPMALVITGSGKRTAESYNGSPSGAPLLHIEYDSANNL